MNTEITNNEPDTDITINESSGTISAGLTQTILDQIGYGSGTEQLLVNSSQASVKGYVDNKFNGALTSASATIATESSGVVTLKAGISASNQAVGNSSGSDITLAKIAKTANATDLVLDVNDYLILNGGNASSFSS